MRHYLITLCYNVTQAGKFLLLNGRLRHPGERETSLRPAELLVLRSRLSPG